MYELFTIFGLLIVSISVWARDFMTIICVISGLAYVAVAIHGRSRTKLGAKVVAEPPVVRPSLLKLLLRRSAITRLKASAVIQFVMAAIGCFFGDQGYFFNRWQAVGLLVLGSLLWVFALFVRRR